MAYFGTVAADGPDHWWRLADPGGLIANDVGANLAKFPTQVGVFGQMPYLGMTSDGLACAIGTSAFLRNDAFGLVLGTTWSLELWYWAFSKVSDFGLIGIQQPAGAFRTAIRANASGNVIGFISGGGSAASVATPSITRWHHVVFTYDHVTLRLYVDGVPDGTFALVANTAGSYQLLIGDEWGGTALVGFMQDVAVYTTTLSAARVLAHFNAADLKNTNPVYAGTATGPLTVQGVGTLDSALSAQILAAVQKTFPRTA